MHEKYTLQFRQVLTNYFQKLDINKTAKDEDKAYLEGFIDAGRAIGFPTEEIQHIIDDVHVQLYGMTINERRKTRALEGESPKAWDVYDSPAWKRKR